jgi:nicotinate-nucleotide--dimethylbenzimidazole phosphoribosyltransferase
LEHLGQKVAQSHFDVLSGWSLRSQLVSQGDNAIQMESLPMPATFPSLAAFEHLLRAMPKANDAAIAAAQDRNMQLTKPPGALGRLEDVAIWVAGWQGTDRPHVDHPQVLIFAGNHGVTAQGVSAFPAEVTVQMVANFKAGGAAINQLSKCFGASMAVHAIELDRPTCDFTKTAAMTESETVEALTIGWNAVDPKADLLVVGEMGIGNTTVAAAMAHALFGGEAADWVGRGTGVSDEGLALKARVVAQAVALHHDAKSNPLEVLRCLGGREIAGMVGAMARARDLRIPLILDGFIACSAAAILHATTDGALDHAIAGHQSAEAAHGRLLAILDKQPLLGLGLRLGEGSGAALAMGIVKAAVACHSGMSTFAEAGVSAGVA